jgi:hypothetical protein
MPGSARSVRAASAVVFDPAGALNEPVLADNQNMLDMARRHGRHPLGPAGSEIKIVTLPPGRRRTRRLVSH